jgi:tRNA (guanosine-2'-O-)-methyltransferase
MMREKLIKHLQQFVTERRLQLFENTINARTRYITVVLEDIFQPQNASAVLRSCECFGIQDVHIIENRNKYRINPDVALGSYKWLSLFKYNQDQNNTLSAIDFLRNKGYRIIATTPAKNNIMLDNLDLNKGKVALLFGSELDGLSPAALEASDEFVRIPTTGFTESLNISVSAAIFIYHLTGKLYQSKINWQLSEEEKQQIRLAWLKNTIKKSDIIEKKFIKNK